jgi:tetratricopeptide (TPR) repeat protein
LQICPEVINLWQDRGIIKSIGSIPANSVSKKSASQLLPVQTTTALTNLQPLKRSKKSAVLNFVIFGSILTTLGALLSPLGIAWWNNSGIGKGVQLSGEQMAALRDRTTAAEKVLLGQPDNQEALKTIVNTKLQLADIKGSIVPLEQLAAMNPDLPEYRVLAGQSHHYLGDRETAALDYRKALANNPHHVPALQSLASLLVDAQKPEAAIGLVQESIKTPIPPGKTADLGGLKLLLAQIYVSQQRYAEAFPIYDGLTQADSQDFRPLLAKALVFKKIGSVSEAQVLLDQAIEVAPAQYKDQIQTLAKSTTPFSATTPPLGTAPIAPSPVAAPSVVPLAPITPAPVPVPSALAQPTTK